MTVTALTGFAQSGKDTAASFLVERGFKRLAFADILRQSLYNLNPIVHFECDMEDDQYSDGSPGCVETVERIQTLVKRWGWDVVKVRYPEVRALLQRMGTEVGRDLYGEQFWVERVTRQIEDDRKVKPRGHETTWSKFVITDVRFPNEAEAVKSLGGRLYRVVRPGTGAVNGHVSDTGIANLAVDGEIINDGCLDTFRERVLEVTGL